jgi:hypothetical protein
VVARLEFSGLIEALSGDQKKKRVHGFFKRDKSRVLTLAISENHDGEGSGQNEKTTDAHASAHLA